MKWLERPGAATAPSGRDQPECREVEADLAGACQGAPNILLIMSEDVGFAVLSTLGGVFPTPSLDRIADAGLSHTIARFWATRGKRESSFLGQSH